MTGRPSKYSAKIADRICEAIASGKSLKSICKGKGFPAESTVYLWLFKHEDFSEQYARAREAQADVYAQEVITIADTAKDAQIARLQIDARKWAAGKLAAKKYGDKVDVNHGGQEGNPVETVNRIELVAPTHDDSET